MYEELIHTIMRHYQCKGRIFTYLVIADNSAYSDFYTAEELEKLLTDCSLHVNQLKFFGSVKELIQNTAAFEEFAEQVYLRLSL